jgi:hypothetical protein
MIIVLAIPNDATNSEMPPSKPRTESMIRNTVLICSISSMIEKLPKAFLRNLSTHFSQRRRIVTRTTASSYPST